MHPSIGFLFGLRSWRARLCYLLTRATARTPIPVAWKARLRSGVSGPYHDGPLAAELRPGTLDGWIFHPLYERGTRDWIRANIGGRSGVMIDVGAHCGSFSLRHRRHFEQVIALEPNPADFAALTRNLELSGAHEVTPVNLAASERPGKVSLYLGTPGTHSLIAIEGGRRVEVEATTLDALLEAHGVRPAEVRLVKVDVEGAEVSVLQGSRRLLQDGAPAIVAEANSQEHASALDRFLQPFGFRQAARVDGRNLVFLKQA